MRILLTVCALLFVFTSSNSLITEMYTINCLNEEFYVLGEHHVQNIIEDSAQLASLLNILEKREREKDEHEPCQQIDICIEQAFDQYGGCATVTSFLHKELLESNLKHTSCQNIEVRIKGGAGVDMLRPDNDPTFYFDFEFSQNGEKVDMKTLTFDEVLEEQEKLAKKVIELQEQEQYSEPTIFKEYMQRADRKRNRLLDELALKNINTYDSILESSLRLFKENVAPDFDTVRLKRNWKSLMSNRHKLQRFVFQMYDPIFELSILQKLMASQAQKKVLVAGAYHARSIKNLLLAKGYTLKKSVHNDAYYGIGYRDLQDIISLPRSNFCYLF